VTVVPGPPDRLTIVFAPDSFKGSLSSVEVARALAEGWARARSDDELLLAPLADGGEGTLAAIEAAGGWESVENAATDPLGRPMSADWLRSKDGERAVVELAAASGLSRLDPRERDAGAASTRGTGEILRSVVDAGIQRVTLGIGGSATTDGGAGILEALGATFKDSVGSDLPGGGEPLIFLETLDLSAVDARLAEVDIRIASDVTNPLLGPTGAAATYGPQKGADRHDVEALDAALSHYADVLEAATGRRERDTPGAGAAGGVGFGLLSLRDRFRSLELVPGVDLVAEETGLDAKLARADIVVTGEGRIDAQTAFGKTALGVARRAQAAGVRCIAVGGGVEPEGAAALVELGVEVVPVHEQPIALEAAIAAGAAPLVACGERLAHSIGPIADPEARSTLTPMPRVTATRRPATKRRRKPDPIKAWVRRLERTRPGLVPFVLDGLAAEYGHPIWERRLDPTSELILTILTQNTADVNAEHAFESLRAAFPSDGPVEVHRALSGWGGVGLPDGRPPDWTVVETAPLDELVEAIRPGGLAVQKAPRIQAALRRIREVRGDHSLEFLGEMTALEARDWLTQIDGIGRKTASVVLLFCFGAPLMPVDRHVERVSRRVGLIGPKATADDAHEIYLGLLEPDQVYEAHVNLITHGRQICHAQRPECARCPIRARCRYVDPKAP
jgi:glycerate 2-kinase